MVECLYVWPYLAHTHTQFDHSSQCLKADAVAVVACHIMRSGSFEIGAIFPFIYIHTTPPGLGKSSNRQLNQNFTFAKPTGVV